MSTIALYESRLHSLPLVARGKVRENYAVGSDRLLMVAGCVDRPLPPQRPAITVATAGLEGWRGVALPFLNALTAGFGYWPIESLVAVAPGPGEVLLDEELMGRMWNAGIRLVRNDGEPASLAESGCPICRCEALDVFPGCVVCWYDYSE